MESDILKQSIETYQIQLSQVKHALSLAEKKSEKEELLSLQENIQQLIELTQENLNQIQPQNSNAENKPDEFALFMAEMEKEGAVESNKENTSTTDVHAELKSLEGMKCRAPHKHQWGDTMYHNALVCSIVPSNHHQSFEEIEVKVMFINPTHEEMLPCPYLLDSDCKFSDDQCKYSHGEVVLFSSLQEYTEPNFEILEIGSKVLAKQNNKLWSRAIIKRLNGEKCAVKFDCENKDLDLELHDVLPLDDNRADLSEDSDDDNNSDKEDIINISLMNTPGTEALGEWEKYTKGIGSKLMQKMGYIIGTGLGRFSDGRTEPVSAIVLPPGKSLDHCMNLREKAGGDKDLFNVEKKLKRLQKKQELKNIKAYEREKKKVDMFKFLNNTLTVNNGPSVSATKSKHRQEIKKETSRNLNVASLKIDEDIKRIERELFKIKDSLKRHSDVKSQLHKSLKEKLFAKQNEIQTLKAKAVNIVHEQKTRNDKKKMSVF